MLAQEKGIEEEMVAWLDGVAPWQTFFTGTTRWQSGNGAMQRAYTRFMAREYPDVSYVYTIEPHHADGFHCHAMFDEGHDIKWTEFWGKWHKRFGRNRTEPIEHKANVQSYVTKYVMKSQQDKRNNHKEEVWWNVWLSRYRARMAGTRGSGFLR